MNKFITSKMDDLDDATYNLKLFTIIVAYNSDQEIQCVR